MGMYLKNSSGWKNLKELYLKNSTGWKKIKTAYLKTSTGWKLLFSSSLTPTIETGALISKSTNATTKLITLTGTNHHWFNSTGITYRFQYSSDGVSFYNLIGATTISNPSVGSSNTATYALSTSDVQPNVDNVYKFIVTATNSTYDTTAASEDSLTIPGIRDITGLTNDNQGYTSLDFSWNGGTYANAFIYQYQDYTGGVGGTWSSQYVTENYFATISYLSPNVTYRIRVKGITGTTTANPGYSGNWAYQTGTTLAPVTPNVTSYPTLSGTAVAKTTVSSGNGSYSNYSSGIAVQSRIVALTNPGLIVQGDTTPQGSVVSSDISSGYQTYTVTQADATNKSYYFFARDTVIGLDGITAYYYYSSGTKSTMGTVTDNFNRTVSGGIGTMSSGFTYSGGYTSPSWSVNGSYAISSASPSFNANYDTWGLRSIEMGGKTDINASVLFPGLEGGLGLAFWVASSGSWWASTVNKSVLTSTVSGCNGTTISTDSSGTGCGGCSVSSSQSTSYNCSGGSNTYPNCSNGSYNCSATYNAPTSTLSCTGSGQGASCPSFSYTAGGYCGNCSGPYTPGPVCDGPYNSYPDGTLSTGCGGKCSCTGPYTTTTYGCGSGTTNYGCPADYTTTYNASTVGTRCSSCIYLGGGLYFYSTVSASTSTSYTCRVSTCAPTYYTYSTYQTVTTPGYYSCYPGSSITTSYTCNPYTNVVTNTYYTSINISSASGSTVYTQSSLDVHSSTSSYAGVYGMTVNTSNNTITAKVYSDYSLSTQLGGTLSYTPSSPTKADIFGSSGVGLAKGPTNQSAGTEFNDFTVS